MKLTLFIFLFLSTVSFSQDLRNTHFFFNPSIDVNEDNFIETALVSNDYTNKNKESLGIKGLYNLDNYSVSAELEFDELSSANFEPSMLQLGGRYNFTFHNLKFSAGSLLNLTSLSSSHDEYYISAFTATRYRVNDRVELSASFLLGPNEDFDNLCSFLGFGSIFSLFQKLNMLAEFNYSLSGNNIDFGLGFVYDISRIFDLRAGFFFNRLDGEVNTIYVGIGYNKLNF